MKRLLLHPSLKRLARARGRVDRLNVRIKDHLNACEHCTDDGESCRELGRLWYDMYEAVGRRKEAEAVRAEALRATRPTVGIKLRVARR